jgi:N-acyl-D-amino-acid deacylase
MCAVAAKYNGCYASHIRSEGEGLHEALKEFLAICRDADLRGEVFHLKDLRKALRRPWFAVSSDGASMAPEGAFLQAPTHPRAYGSFARVLGHYVRDEKVLTLADAVHRMSGLPAATLGLRQRGLLSEGYFADVVVFDPSSIADRATFANPHQLSTGVSEVLVNGKITISGGAFTGELAGRALAGRGARR